MGDGSLLGWIWGIGVLLTYTYGVYCALDAIMETRTAQGAIAWALALVTIPFVALPLYWVFGRAKFDDYIKTLRKLNDEMDTHLQTLRTGVLKAWIIDLQEEDDLRTRGELQCFRRLSTLHFTHGNEVKLLIDGAETFKALFDGIDEAERFVLVQFYIIRDDDVGRQLKSRLIEAIGRGVHVYLLYDEVGSHGLSRQYLRELREAGGHVSGSLGHRGWLGRFRLNFRNHRKVVVVDGKKAFLGGLNVGVEYLGEHPRLSPWRDTHVVIEGPSVLGLQYSFVRDWFFGQKEVLDISWDVQSKKADQYVLILASGPADPLETCALLFTHAIESAEERVWIASPYFVPDGRVMGALQLAALRGVDVRILMPRLTDNVLFKFVPYAFLPEVEQAGVKIHLYEEGFMHQKVFLVDNDYAAVGTANFDNRSFLLNFEITCLVNDAVFCANVEKMLLHDFAASTQIGEDELRDRSFLFRLATQTTRLLAPVL
ncbi:MAG: cardiolipin synthase [Rhodothermaceae bacterium]|nr:cardiolipin synthase [Rhodothermaceae bacterium]